MITLFRRDFDAARDPDTARNALGLKKLASTATATDITNVPTDRLLGRDTAATGAAEYITVGGGIEFTGSGGIQVVAASDTVAGKIEIAVQSEMETATDTTRAVVPGRVQYHPGVAKAWVHYNESAGAIGASYGVSSVSDDGTGVFTINFTTAFSSVNYAAAFGGTGVAGVWFVKQSTATVPTTSAYVVNVFDFTPAAADGDRVSCTFFGDQ